VKHRNRCVFDGCSLSVEVALSTAREELMCWRLAGAKTLSFFHLEELPYVWESVNSGVSL
jgi:hypothetical protein